MLIALVFMLFCVFVGGSVLAAATANGARLKQSAQEEQDYLSARSAALLTETQLLSDGSTICALRDACVAAPGSPVSFDLELTAPADTVGVVMSFSGGKLTAKFYPGVSADGTLPAAPELTLTGAVPMISPTQEELDANPAATAQPDWSSVKFSITKGGGS